MPRPVSWLPRLHEISRAVANSVRSHYDRRDLEQLFELQPRAAQKLIEILPSVPIGTSRLVERSDLAHFLDRVRKTDDTAALFETLRQENLPPQSALAGPARPCSRRARFPARYHQALARPAGG